MILELAGLAVVVASWTCATAGKTGTAGKKVSLFKQTPF